MYKFSALLSKILTAIILTGICLPLSVSAANDPDPKPTGPNSPDPNTLECNSPLSERIITSDFLTVLTLNLAHGRKDAFNQMLQRTRTTRSNLEEIAGYFSDSGADLIALQEADHASRWSGKFNHVDFVSEKSPYPCRLHAHQAQKFMYDFGTALLSRVPFTNSLSHTFTPSPPTTNKGFVMAQVRWNPAGALPEAVTVSVLSVHLDFSRKKVRESQIKEIQAMFPVLTTPLIIMGDFNADWGDEDSAIKAIVANGNLKVYRPGAPGLGTYKSGKHRLDWILISKDLEFQSYSVPGIVLSDHQPVLATLRLVDISAQQNDSSPSQSGSDTGHD